MRIKFHLDSAELMSCASGSQPEALGAIISTHLSMCSYCRQELKLHSLIGESLFNNLDSSPLDFIKTPQLSMDTITGTSINSQSQKLHNVLRHIFSGQSNKIDWNPLNLGVSDFSFSLSKKDSGTLRLIKLEPDVSLPNFERSGTQIVLVLDGALSDNTGLKSKGDIVHISPECPYSPTANSIVGCICLIGSETVVDMKKLLHQGSSH